METLSLRPVARWIPTTDDSGRRRLVMVWEVPDLDAAAASLAPAGVDR